MISYVWEHLEIGYVQGMCDLLAPLMVILDDGEWDIISQVDDVKHLSIMLIIQAILWNPLETADSEAWDFQEAAEDRPAFTHHLMHLHMHTVKKV